MKKTLLLTLLTCLSLYSVEMREGTFQVALTPQFTEQKSLEFANGASAHINASSSIELMFGYNINSFIELAVLMNSNSSNYEGTRVYDSGKKEQYSENLTTSSFSFSGTYNIFEDNFTPFIETHIGSTFVDSGVETGEEGGGCWVDPWYGYVCSSTNATYTDTKMSYGASIGVRYDFENRLFLKAAYSKHYIDFNSNNSPDFNNYRLSVGSTF